MMPLAMCSEGEEVKVNCVDCGAGLKKRLCDLGLYDGSIINIVKNDVSGPVIIKLKDSKLAIGRGQANKILVEIGEHK
ncbi:MAG: FeoA family protein [Nanoarchaeota archaeon]